MTDICHKKSQQLRTAIIMPDFSETRSSGGIASNTVQFLYIEDLECSCYIGFIKRIGEK